MSRVTQKCTIVHGQKNSLSFVSGKSLEMRKNDKKGRRESQREEKKEVREKEGREKMRRRRFISFPSTPNSHFEVTQV